MSENNPKNRIEILTACILGLFLTALIAFFVSRVPARADATVDESLLMEISGKEAVDLQQAASRIFSAESSRQKRIQDSIDYSISVEESSYQAMLDSIAAAMNQLSSYMQSVKQSQYEEASFSQSLSAALKASREEEKQSSKAEASRQASIAASKAAAAKNNSGNSATRPQPVATSNVVFIGDSRTYGLSFYGCWPRSHVFFTTGMIDYAPQMATEAAAMAPEKVIFLNGVDDILYFGYEQALGHYENYIANFAALSPETKIYVGNVMPAASWAIERRPRLGGIEAYNQLIQEMCARHGWTFVDGMGGFTIEACYSLNGDGIHFSASWTRTWFNNIRSIVGF